MDGTMGSWEPNEMLENGDVGDDDNNNNFNNEDDDNNNDGNLDDMIPQIVLNGSCSSIGDNDDTSKVNVLVIIVLSSTKSVHNNTIMCGALCI